MEAWLIIVGILVSLGSAGYVMVSWVIKALEEENLGKVKELEIEAMENGEPGPEMELEPSPEDYPLSEPPPKYPPKKFSALQAKLFIKMINDFSGYIDTEFLSMFDRDLIKYAINVANKAARENARESQYNRIYNAKRYWAMVEYVDNTEGLDG